MIDRYVQDVRKCLEGGCYFAALSLSLALPDICGMVEWPNRSVPERYIGWADQFLSAEMSRDGDQLPCISGEVLYNLRNTFLHQGAPTIDGQKVRQARNQLDEFQLILGDGDIRSISFTISRSDADVRVLMVNVRYLCHAVCDAAEAYWRGHGSRIDFGYQVLSQSDLLGERSPLRHQLAAERGAVVQKDAAKQKALDSGKSEAPEKQASDSPKQAPAAAKKAPQKPAKKPSPQKKAPAPLIDEHRLRCFFGEKFKEQKFKSRKEAILEAVLTARNKVELNNNLTRLFPGQDVKVIHERLKPLTGTLPGK